MKKVIFYLFLLLIITLFITKWIGVVLLGGIALAISGAVILFIGITEKEKERKRLVSMGIIALTLATVIILFKIKA